LSEEDEPERLKLEDEEFACTMREVEEGIGPKT
jgi:hypothetical protein